MDIMDWYPWYMIYPYPHYPCNPCEGECTKKLWKCWDDYGYLDQDAPVWNSKMCCLDLSGGAPQVSTQRNAGVVYLFFCNILLMFYLRAFDRFFLALGTNTLIPCAWSTHFSSWDLLRPGSWKLRSQRMNDPAFAAAEYQRLCHEIDSIPHPQLDAKD